PQRHGLPNRGREFLSRGACDRPENERTDCAEGRSRSSQGCGSRRRNKAASRSAFRLRERFLVLGGRSYSNPCLYSIAEFDALGEGQFTRVIHCIRLAAHVVFPGVAPAFASSAGILLAA